MARGAILAAAIPVTTKPWLYTATSTAPRTDGRRYSRLNGDQFGQVVARLAAVGGTNKYFRLAAALADLDK
jgi:hypothetical protein